MYQKKLRIDKESSNFHRDNKSFVLVQIQFKYALIFFPFEMTFYNWLGTEIMVCQ